MNDDTDKPLNTVGDDALEARITAWVLGEASSFEAGEPEKLCAADPALRLFERRLRVLHGLVAEDFQAGPAVEWKLAAERRAKITDLLGVEPQVEEVLARRTKSRGPSVRGLILALAACLVLGLFSVSVIGGIGQSAKESKVMASYSARSEGIVRESAAMADMNMSPERSEPSSGAPVKKPASSYAHLTQKSAFTAKPPPAMRAADEASDTTVYRQARAGANLADASSAPGNSALDGVDRSNPGAGSGGPTGTVAMPVAPAAKPASGPAPEDQALALNEPRPLKERKDAILRRGSFFGMRGAESSSETVPAQAAPEIATRTNSDFISPVEGMTSPGEPAATGDLDADIVSGGNRSGDGAITRNNIDAILNNPSRPATAEEKGQGIAALTGTFSDEAMDTILESVDAKSDGQGRGLGGGSGGAPDLAFQSRTVNGVRGGGADRFVPHEGPSQESVPADGRFKMNLRLGSERTDFENQGAAFGNLEEMGRLAGERKAELGGRQSGDYHFTDSSSGATQGGDDLSDLARKELDVGQGIQPEGPYAAWLLSKSDQDHAAPQDRKALADAQAPAGTAPNAFFNSPELPRQMATPAPAEADEFEGFVNPGAPIGGATSDDGTLARFRKESGVLGEAVNGGLKQDLSKDRGAIPVDSEGEAGARLQEQVAPLDLSFHDGALAVAEPAARESMAKLAAKPGEADRDAPIPITPAPRVTDPAAVEEVRRKLSVAEGASNLGKYEESQKAYEEVLRIDPYNKAARRGMEQVAQATADYYRAAYDQTRAQLLAEVDKAWELPVPYLIDSPQVTTGSALMVDKRESIVIPEFKLENVTVDEALDLLRVRAIEFDTIELDPARKGVPFVLAKPAANSGLADPGKLRLHAIDLKNVKLGDAIQEIARQSGLEAEVGSDAVTFRIGPETPSKADQIVDLMSETLATDEPFSTFSLHVSDASFKLAHAAMERGEVPAAEGIRPEEFYNAFDYGDSAPANGEPVVCVTEQSAHPAFPQRNLLRIGVRTGSQGRGASTPLNLTLLLDHSGSMEREDRNAGLAMAVRQLSGLLKEGDTITVAGFSRQPRLLADRLPGARAQELNDLIARTPSEGGTNLEEGLKLGEELAKRQFNPAAQNRVVLFTDGAANLGDARPEALQARIEGLRQQGIAFDAAGFGADGLNDKLLERLTRDGNGRYYIVDGPEDADAGFAKQLAGAFRPAAENVKVQVRFNPARVAKYKLIGFEEHRLQKEDFRNDAVDAAEMAAEEAGNALYQIETLPQGEGEVGEVSVRFRDVASGQMVERTWTIPYDAQAPAFDQATPSIQLAGLAAFAAEKLRAAPMADAVDFQQLGQVYAGVRARYPNSQPVADLGSMIGKMK